MNPEKRYCSCSNVDRSLVHSLHLHSYYITIHCDLFLFRELFTDFRIRILFSDIRWIDRLSWFFVKANMHSWGKRGRGGKGRKGREKKFGNFNWRSKLTIHFSIDGAKKDLENILFRLDKRMIPDWKRINPKRASSIFHRGRKF